MAATAAVDAGKAQLGARQKLDGFKPSSFFNKRLWARIEMAATIVRVVVRLNCTGTIVRRNLTA
jgi:hypothetical protein